MGMALTDVTLDDKYRFDKERIYLNGIQALVRLPLMQRFQDQAHGLNTAGFISGYRGSPLGGYDLYLSQAQEFLKEQDIHFQPGLNEDIALTTVWGSQQVALRPQNMTHDGVFGIWYGKGPGVDRSLDALKHANAAGTHANGGVLLLAGDDHSCKSSTFPHQSEQALIHCFVPMLNPSSIQDILDMGLFGIAMSRYSGLWVGFKCLGDTMDSSASVYARHEKIDFKIPTDFKMPEGGLSIRWPDTGVAQEARVLNYKLPAAKAFARANNIDKVTYESKKQSLGIVTTGKAYNDVMQALRVMDMEWEDVERLGISIYKIGMVWPLEDQGLKEFAKDKQALFIVEEKRGLIEEQAKSALYGMKNAPEIVGKKKKDGSVLLPDYYEITPYMIAEGIMGLLKDLKLSKKQDLSVFEKSMKALRKSEDRLTENSPIARTPYYCSGCPHNTSTKVPEGSRAMAGIGCHYMATWIDNNTSTFTQMGGEGTPWIGQSPFLNEDHIFANLGDGTYQHSGLMAIRAACAASYDGKKTGQDFNITYKILYNDAVAMTGGQDVEGQLSVDQISRQVAAEGVTKIVVVSDDIEKYAIKLDGVAWNFAQTTEFYDRSDLMRVQKMLRETKGVSVMIYDQTCAAEKRRRRKRGKMHDPIKRVMINEQVCEGCGDCGKKSNCVSILPVETDYGRKRQIDQSSCNKDYSCVDGFCPSFVTIEGTDLKKPEPSADASIDDRLSSLPEPKKHDLKKGNWSILLTGIGGTGVVTIGALLAMAAHLEGKGGQTMDQIGLAQKGGAVMTHIRFGEKPEKIFTAKIGVGQADVIMGSDMVVTSGGAVLSTLKKQKTVCILNSNVMPTGDFTKMPDLQIPDQLMVDIIKDAVGEDFVHILPITQLATRLLGNSIATNMFLMGYTYQKGLIPLEYKSIMRAIELNGVAVAMNKRAFAWGRLAAQDLQTVVTAAQSKQDATLATYRQKSSSLEEKIARRVAMLTDYQNKAYATRYQTMIDRVKAKDLNKDKSLTKAIAQYLYKVMAYKDEYEVARLYTQTDFKAQIKAQFKKGYKVKFHLAPPLIAKRDKDTGELKKMELGSYMFPLFSMMAKLKGLRGTPFDIFGYTSERKIERQLITDYQEMMTHILNNLNKDNYDLALQLASIPEDIRGFGHVKERHFEAAMVKQADLLARFNGEKALETKAA